jgi:hypothetical protein
LHHLRAIEFHFFAPLEYAVMRVIQCHAFRASINTCRLTRANSIRTLKANRHFGRWDSLYPFRQRRLSQQVWCQSRDRWYVLCSSLFRVGSRFSQLPLGMMIVLGATHAAYRQHADPCHTQPWIVVPSLKCMLIMPTSCRYGVPRIDSQVRASWWTTMAPVTWRLHQCHQDVTSREQSNHALACQGSGTGTLSLLKRWRLTC